MPGSDIRRGCTQLCAAPPANKAGSHSAAGGRAVRFAAAEWQRNQQAIGAAAYSQTGNSFNDVGPAGSQAYRRTQEPTGARRNRTTVPLRSERTATPSSEVGKEMSAVANPDRARRQALLNAYRDVPWSGRRRRLESFVSRHAVTKVGLRANRETNIFANTGGAFSRGGKPLEQNSAPEETDETTSVVPE